MKKEKKFKVLDSDSSAVAVGEKRKRLADEKKGNPTPTKQDQIYMKYVFFFKSFDFFHLAPHLPRTW
jgi:hypothetical protein